MSTEEVPREEPDNGSESDGSRIWAKIAKDVRIMIITESLNKILILSVPPVIVQVLLYIASFGTGFFFLLLIYYTWGAGAIPSDPLEDDILEKNAAILSVCSAQTSNALTRLMIVMLVSITTAGASMFIYLYDQKRHALSVATVAVTSCQLIVQNRDHAINKLVAKQMKDTAYITQLEKENKQLREK